MKKEYDYRSQLNGSEFHIGENLIISNHIQKGEFNVAGKPVLVRILSKSESLEMLWSPLQSIEEKIQTTLENSSNEGGNEGSNKEPVKNISNIYNGLFDAKTNSDPYGDANFSIQLTNAGKYQVAVFFLHSRHLYSEHVNFLDFQVVDPKSFQIGFLLPFLLLPLGLFVVGMFLFIRKRYFNWAEFLLFPNLLFFRAVPPEDRWSMSKLIGASAAHWILLLLLVVGVVKFGFFILLGLVGLFFFHNRFIHLFVIEILLLFILNHFFNQYIGLEIIDHLGFSIFYLSLISLLIPAFPFFSAVWLLVWLKGIDNHLPYQYFVVLSLMGMIICFLLYAYKINGKKLVKIFKKR